MSGENSLQKAQELYDEGQYDKAAQMAIDIQKETLEESGTRGLEPTLLTAKAFLSMLPWPTSDEHRNSLLDMVRGACGCVQSIDEMKYVESEMSTAFSRWERRGMNADYARLVREPKLENYDKLLSLPVEYIKFSIMITVTTRNCEFANKYREEHQLEMRDYVRFMENDDHEEYTEDERKALYLESALQIFENARQYLAENAHSSAEFSKSVAKQTIEAFVLAQLLVGRSIDDDMPDEVKCERTKIKAEMKKTMLDALIYPNGQTMSVYCGDRAAEVTELKELYEQIQGWEPTFVMPMLPSVVGIGGQQASSSGCYVATAVYGSYDCPQVWTLRRFRDDMLAETWYGRLFIKTYYAISPTLVKWFGETAWFKNLWRPTLDRMVKKLNDRGVEDTAYNDRSW